jgi:hypothetical protein
MWIATSLYKGWQALAERFDLDKSSVYLAAKRGRRYLQDM